MFEPDRGEPTGRFLLDQRHDAIAPCDQGADERFGLSVVGDCHGEIQISCEPWFGARRHGVATHNGA